VINTEFKRIFDAQTCKICNKRDRLLVKVVENRFIGLQEGKHTYNLGFGTYNHQKGNSVST
jgi:hypothetical protein